MYRKATLEDCKAVYKLICDLECRELPFDAFAEIFAEQVANGNYYCLLWEQEGSVVAALNLRFERQLHHASRIAEILEFEVAASCRSCGSQIELATNQLRKDAHRFYTREGMHNFHYKFSKSFAVDAPQENAIGR